MYVNIRTKTHRARFIYIYTVNNVYIYIYIHSQYIHLYTHTQQLLYMEIFTCYIHIYIQRIFPMNISYEILWYLKNHDIPWFFSPGATASCARLTQWSTKEQQVWTPRQDRPEEAGAGEQNHGKTMGKWWFHRKTIGNP